MQGGGGGGGGGRQQCRKLICDHACKSLTKTCTRAISLGCM